MIVRCAGCGAWLWQGRTRRECTTCTVLAILNGTSSPGAVR